MKTDEELRDIAQHTLRTNMVNSTAEKIRLIGWLLADLDGEVPDHLLRPAVHATQNMQNIEAGMPTHWGDTTFPLEVANDDGARVSLDRLLYCRTWEGRGAKGGFEAVFAITHLNNGTTGHLSWVVEYEKRDMVVDKIESDIPGLDGLALDIYLGPADAKDYGVEPVGLDFQHTVYDMDECC